MTDPTPAEALKANYEARICPGIPTDCCDYGVISHETGKEVCRVWTEEDARRIADLLNLPRPPAADAGEVQDIIAALKAAHEFMHSVAAQRRKFGPISTQAQHLGWQMKYALDRLALPQAPSPTFADAIETACAAFEQAISDGYPEPVGKGAKCPHGLYSFEECITCYDEALMARIAEIRGDAGVVRTYRDGIEAAAKVAEDDVPQSDETGAAVGEAKAGVRIAAAIRRWSDGWTDE